MTLFCSMAFVFAGNGNAQVSAMQTADSGVALAVSLLFGDAGTLSFAAITKLFQPLIRSPIRFLTDNLAQVGPA